MTQDIQPNTAGYQPPGFWVSLWQGIAGAPQYWENAIVDPNAPDSDIITAIEGAGEGIRNNVSLTAEGSINVMPILGNKYNGPGPVGMGPGGTVDVSFAHGLQPTLNVSVGKFGVNGYLGITFNIGHILGLTGEQVYTGSASGGNGEGGGISISFDRNFKLTGLSVTIGFGFGLDVSGNIPIPVNGASH
jgi:hypothetical protein